MGEGKTLCPLTLGYREGVCVYIRGELGRDHTRRIERSYSGSPWRPEQVLEGAQWNMLSWALSVRTHSTNFGAARKGEGASGSLGSGNSKKCSLAPPRFSKQSNGFEILND